METETIDRLFLELSQVTTAKTKRELELERALRRQAQSHASICDVLREEVSGHFCPECHKLTSLSLNT